MVSPRVPHALTGTGEFTEAVDDLMQDPAVPNSTLHSHAQRHLQVFRETNPIQVDRGPAAWAERIHKASPRRPRFTTRKLFNAMYSITDELGLVAGKRYVSAAICACGEHAGREPAGPPMEDLAQAHHQLSSIWAVFLLWPREFLLGMCKHG
ncbi:hypothetical protein LXA43DRAFT_243424 [Ganoderma leucocontextum]|nr:hypothetical protein LXA43DRAFT_243424 [Ganoderma leucocontextum]